MLTQPVTNEREEEEDGGGYMNNLLVNVDVDAVLLVLETRSWLVTAPWVAFEIGFDWPDRNTPKLSSLMHFPKETMKTE